MEMTAGMIRQPDPEEVAGWETWVNSRPLKVSAVARQFNPWQLYRMKSTGHRVLVYSFDDPTSDPQLPVTLTVLVLGKFNKVAFERKVFGIPPEDLEPCELPAPEEEVGAALTDPEEIKAALALHKMLGPLP